MLPSNYLTSTLTELMCTTVTGICVLLEEFFCTDDPEADDTDRFQVYMGHFPSGTPTQSVLHYGQNIREDRFQVYADDYVTWFGIGQKRKTDLIPIQNIAAGSVPVAMFAGQSDILGDPIDAQWTEYQLGKQCIHYQEITGGHLTFMIGKDMTWFSEDVMDLIKEYNPVSTESTQILQ